MPWSLKYTVAIIVGIFAASMVALARASKGTPFDNGPRIDAAKAQSLTPDWTDADFRNLAAIASSNKINPADLLLVLASESGLNPRAQNKNSEGFSIAVGLNQLTTSANSTVGITEGQRLEVPTWPVSQQLPLIARMFAAIPWSRAGRNYDHAGLVYEANFAPSIMLSRGTSPETVLYSKAADGIYYERNRGFDVANKGTITVGDLIEHLRKVADQPIYHAALQRMRDATGDGSLSPQLPIG